MGEILNKTLKITFVNPNTEEDIVQAMAGVLAYNLANKNENLIFDCSKSPEKKSVLKKLSKSIATKK